MPQKLRRHKILKFELHPRTTESTKMKMYKVLSIVCLMIIAGQSEEVLTSEDVNETLTEGEEVSKVRFFLEKISRT